ncbi:hypothetical protein Tco_0956540 [Tanacetum coccineum]
MVVNKEWLARNDEYIERKVLKELKLKRKREEKKSPGRWTRGDEAKDLAEKHKKIKKQQQDTESSRKIEDKGKKRVLNVEEDAERKRKIKGKEKEKVVDVEEDVERKKKVKVKGKEILVDSKKGSEKNKRINKQKHNSVLKGRATVRQLFEAMRRLSPERKKVIREIGFRDLIEFPIFEIPTKLAFYVVDILNTTNMMLECPMGEIVITPKIVKQVLGLPMGIRDGNDRPERVQRSILATVERPVMNIECDRLIANTLGSCENSSTVNFTVLKNVFEGDDNEESYRKETHSNDEDDVEIIAEVQKDERNETHYTAECSEKKDEQETKTSKKDEANNNKEEGMAYTKAKNQKIVGEVQKDGRNENQNIAECSEKKDEQETGTSKKDEADNNKEEGMANKKATNQKRNEEIDPFDDPKFGEYYIQNEHLFVPTQTSAEKKKDQTNDVNWDSFLENEEEIIRKGRGFSAEIRKKAQQQEQEQKLKEKKSSMTMKVPGILEDKTKEIDKKIDA